MAAFGGTQRPFGAQFHHINGCQEGSTVTWKGELFPGEKALVAVAAGGRMQVAGPVEKADIPIANAGWIFIEAPRASELIAAQENCERWVSISVEGAVEGAWEGRRPSRSSNARRSKEWCRS